MIQLVIVIVMITEVINDFIFKVIVAILMPYQCYFNVYYVTVFGKSDRLARKTNYFFIALLPLMSSEDADVQI